MAIHKIVKGREHDILSYEFEAEKVDDELPGVPCPSPDGHAN